MVKKVVIAVLVAVLIIAVALLLYSFGSGFVTPGFSTLSQPSPAAKETVGIGIIAPLTGTSSDNGMNIQKGIELAAEEINSNPKLKYKVQIFLEDSQYKSELSVSAMQKLVNVDGVDFVVGDYGSSQTLAIAPIANENKVILISPSSQSSKITEAGDFVFRTQTNTRQEAAFLSKFISGKKGFSKGCIIAFNTDFGVSYIEDFPEFFSKLGGKLVSVQKFESTETDFRTLLLKCVQESPDFIFIVANRTQGGLILKQAKESGIGLPFIAASPIEGQELLNLAQDSAEGLIYPYPFDDESAASAQKEFQEKFLKKFRKKSEMTSANSYDALKVLANCFEKVGVETEKVKDCLYATQNYQGASGTLGFDKFGDVEKPFIAKAVRDGKFVRIS